MKPDVSFEYSAFRSESDFTKILDTATKLEVFKPTYHSVTFGAGGSTKQGTEETVTRLRQAGFNSIPHLSWGASQASEIFAAVETYRNQGVREMVVLRGDVPAGSDSKANLPSGEKLVELLRSQYAPAELHLRVGCYPEVHPDAASAAADLDSLKAKVNAGADECVTQYFYNVDAFTNFANQYVQKGITVPLVPGVMPITNFQRIVRFSDKCGAEVPRWLRWRLDELKDDAESLRSFGVDVVSALCDQLIQFGVPELHFYTLNRSLATRRILKNLGF